MINKALKRLDHEKTKKQKPSHQVLIASSFHITHPYVSNNKSNKEWKGQ